MRMLGLVAVFFVIAPTASQRWLKPWTYNCSNNPDEWGNKYSTCKDTVDFGFQASPINIQLEGESINTANSPEPVEFESGLHTGTFRATSNLLVELFVSTAETNPQLVQFVKDDKETDQRIKEPFHLERIVFHHPSEHTLNGKRFPLEVQLHFHEAVPPPKGEPKRLAIGVFGIIADNTVVTPPIQSLGKVFEDRLSSEGLLLENFNPVSLLPLSGSYFTYFGGDTAPPCTHNIKWVIMEHTVNFTASFLRGLKREIAVFHPNAPAGNARPLKAQTAVQVSRHATGTLLMMEAFSFTQSQVVQLVTQGFVQDAKAADVPPPLLYDQEYKIMPLHKCIPPNKTRYGLPEDIPIYSHPDILRLRPDTTVVEQSKTANVAPRIVAPRVPLTTPANTHDIPPPKIKFVTWTADEASKGTDKYWKEMCDEWKAHGSDKSAPIAEYCHYIFSAPPQGAEVFADVPMKNPPSPPWKPPIPSNLPLSPRFLGNPKLPDVVNPYNPLADSRIPYDPNEPTSGNSPYMHLANGDEIPFLKPGLSAGADQ